MLPLVPDAEAEEDDFLVGVGVEVKVLFLTMGCLVGVVGKDLLLCNVSNR